MSQSFLTRKYGGYAQRVMNGKLLFQTGVMGEAVHIAGEIDEKSCEKYTVKLRKVGYHNLNGNPQLASKVKTIDL
jgi:hypothetical protein